MANKYFLYARKSQESEERQILSIEAQITELRLFAEKEKLEIIEEFIEAMTAKVPGRHKFNQMLEKLEKGEARGIVAWHPDRLARNSVDGGRIIYFLDTGHIQSLKFSTFWFENTPQGKFMMNIAFGQSKYWIDNLSENIKRGNRQKLRNGGWPSMAPIGYLNDKASRTVIVDPVQGPMVAKIFQEYSTGKYTLKEIRDMSKEWGLVSRRKKNLGGRLAIACIEKILKTSFYYGLMEYNGEHYQGNHNPLITKELFDKVQEVLRKRGRNHEERKHHFPFLHFATCKSCGCAITAERQKGHHYYRCTKKKKPCQERYVREELLDKQISQTIQDVALPFNGYQEMLALLEQDRSKASQTLQQEKQGFLKSILEIGAQLEKLLDLHLQGVISQQEYLAKKEGFIKRKISIEEKLNQLKEKGNVWLEPMQEFLAAAHQADQVATDKNLAAKREFLKKIGSNFRVWRQTLEFSYIFPWPLLKKSRPISNWFGEIDAYRIFLSTEEGVRLVEMAERMAA